MLQTASYRGGQGGLAQVMAAAALWATVGVASQMVPGKAGLSDDVLGMARLALGGPIILAIAVLLGKASLAAILRLNPRDLAGFVFGSVVFQVCLFRAFTGLGVTATVFLTVCLPPLLSSAWSWLRGQQALSRGGALALGLAVTGLVVFSLSSSGPAQGSGSAIGLLQALLASIAFVIMTRSARDLTRSAGPLIVAGLGLTLAGLCLFLAIAAIDPHSIQVPAQDAWPLATLIAYLALGPTALAYVIYCTGMARCRSTDAGLIASMIEPGLAALLAWFLLGETLAPAQTLGCLLIAAAMIALWSAENRAQRP